MVGLGRQVIVKWMASRGGPLQAHFRKQQYFHTKADISECSFQITIPALY